MRAATPSVGNQSFRLVEVVQGDARLLVWLCLSLWLA